MMPVNLPDWSDNDIARATTLGGDLLRFVAATNINTYCVTSGNSYVIQNAIVHFGLHFHNVYRSAASGFLEKWEIVALRQTSILYPTVEHYIR